MRAQITAEAPENAGLDETQRAEDYMFLRMRAQSSDTRHDLVLHDTVFQPKIMSLNKVA